MLCAAYVNHLSLTINNKNAYAHIGMSIVGVRSQCLDTISTQRKKKYNIKQQFMCVDFAYTLENKST